MNTIQYKGYIFDLDGTIYLGSEAIKGAVDTVNQLMQSNKKVLFLTNKTIESRDGYVTKLNGLGIPVTQDQILSPVAVTISLLHKHHHGAKIYVIGEQIFKDELRREGIQFAVSPEETELVILSWDRNLHYDQLNFAYQAIKLGAGVLATNPDRTCPVPGGDMPDCGSLIGALEGATGQPIKYIAGKPSIHMAKAAFKALGLAPVDCLMIGDRLETDVLIGKYSSMNTALVLTGASQIDDIASAEHLPDYVLNSVCDLSCLNDNFRYTNPAVVQSFG